jgi:putative endonuclease
MPYFVYILKCADGSYYTGSTSDIHRRISEHENGVDRKFYTHSRRPIEFIWQGEFSTKEEAFAFERQVKGWSRKKKEALIENNWIAIHEIVKTERKERELKKKNKA